MTRYKRFVLGFASILIISGWLTVPGAALSQDTATPTPTPRSGQPRSLFVEDICAPPCWFRLTPGETAAEDVPVMFQQFEELFYTPISARESIFDPETGQMIDGAYILNWRPSAWTREDTANGTSTIVIREGIVSKIKLAINHPVNLGQVLDALGTPTQVEIGNVGNMELILGLYYPELPLGLSLIAIQEDCFTANIQTQFNVGLVGYYSPDYELIPQAYVIYDHYRLVLLETWEAWLRGEVEGTCREALDQLPKVTPTPSPE